MLNTDYLMGGFKSTGLPGSSSVSVDAGPYPEVLPRFINDPKGGLGDRKISSVKDGKTEAIQSLYNCASKFKRRVLQE